MKILIISLNYLGDILMTLPLHYNLKKNDPDLEIAVSIGYRGAVLKNIIKNVDKWIIRKNNINIINKLKNLKEVKNFNPDITIIIDDSKFSHKLAKYSSSKRVIGFNKSKIKNFKIDKINYEYQKNKHLVSRMVKILEYLDIKDYEYKVFFEDIECDIDYNDYIVFLPGTTRKSKLWKIDYWVELGKRLKRKFNKQIILMGAKSDAYISKKFSSAGYDYVDLIGKTNIKELYCYLKNSDIVISVDNGGMHLSDYLNNSTIALFGSTDYRKVGPRGENSYILEADFNCLPCEKSEFKNDKYCLNIIKPEDILSIIDDNRLL